jgi:hypothetical protein
VTLPFDNSMQCQLVSLTCGDYQLPHNFTYTINLGMG